MGGVHVFGDEHKLGNLFLRVGTTRTLRVSGWLYTVYFHREVLVFGRKRIEAVSDVHIEAWVVTARVLRLEAVHKKGTKSAAKLMLIYAVRAIVEIVSSGGDDQHVDAGKALSSHNELAGGVLNSGLGSVW